MMPLYQMRHALWGKNEHGHEIVTLIALLSNEGSGEHSQRRILARAFAARRAYKKCARRGKLATHLDL